MNKLDKELIKDIAFIAIVASFPIVFLGSVIVYGFTGSVIAAEISGYALIYGMPAWVAAACLFEALDW